MCRGENYQRLRRIIDDLLLGHVREDGFVITVDNGYVAPLEKLRRIRGAGRSNWTYFKRDDLATAPSRGDVSIHGFGLVNFGAATFLFKRDFEIINDLLYFLDKVLVRVLKPKDRAVLGTVIAKRAI